MLSPLRLFSASSSNRCSCQAGDPFLRQLDHSAGLVNHEPGLDGVTDQVPGRPPHLPVVVQPLQELPSGELQGSVETKVGVFLGLIPVRRETRDSGAEVGADGIAAFTIVGRDPVINGINLLDEMLIHFVEDFLRELR